MVFGGWGGHSGIVFMENLLVVKWEGGTYRHSNYQVEKLWEILCKSLFCSLFARFNLFWPSKLLCFCRATCNNNHMVLVHTSITNNKAHVCLILGIIIRKHFLQAHYNGVYILDSISLKILMNMMCQKLYVSLFYACCLFNSRAGRSFIF